MNHHVKHNFVWAMFILSTGSFFNSYDPIFAAIPGAPTATIEGEILDEISGMTNTSDEGQYWGHSDSGFAAAIHRFTDKGKVLQSVQLSGVTNRDFEAMTRDDQGHLYIADTGDNGLSQGTYQIYHLTDDIPASATAAKAVRIDFTYEDHRSRNCEAMFAFDGKLYLLSKQEIYERHPEIFELVVPAGGGTSTAKLLGRLNMKGRVTDVAYSSQHKLLAVLTYHGVAFYDFTGPQDLLTKPKHYIYGSFAKCEAICFDRETIVLTNENEQLWKLSLDSMLTNTWVGPMRPTIMLARTDTPIRVDGRTVDWPGGATEFSLKPERLGATLQVKMVASREGWHVALTIPYQGGGGKSRPIGDTLFVMVSPQLDDAFPTVDTSVFAITVIEKNQTAKVFRMQQPLPWEGRGNWKSQSSPAGSAALRFVDGKLTIEALIDQDFLNRSLNKNSRQVRFNIALLSWQGKKPSFWSWAGPLRGHGDEKLQSWGIVTVPDQ